MQQEPTGQLPVGVVCTLVCILSEERRHERIFKRSDIIRLSFVKDHSEVSVRIKQKLTEVRSRKLKIMVGNFYWPISIMGKNSQTEVSRRIELLNHSTNQLDLTDIYRTFEQQQQNRQLLKCLWNILQDSPYTGP